MKSSFSRRSFLQFLGTAAVAAPFVAHGWKGRSPNSLLGHASFGAGGMAGADIGELVKFDKQLQLIAVAEVDPERAAPLKKRFPGLRVYKDFRKLLETEGSRIDSVNVSTPDHVHAVMAVTAMELGKHVYGQKPLAHDLFEVRRMTEMARAKQLVTQMGIQINSSTHYRTATVLAQSGAIGKIKAVHSWCSKTWGDPGAQPDREDPIPAGFDWDLWLGPCAKRPFIGNGYYHPGNWRKRLDFGTGTFGDMGCHIFDPVFTSLELKAPISVRSEGPVPNQWNWAIDSHIEYVFEGTPFTAEKTIPVTWYDGAAKPPKDVLDLLEGDGLPDTGSILVGTQGVMVIPHIARPLLYPDKKFQNLRYPEVPSVDHWGQFIEGCREGARTSANFDYAGPLTEAVLLGGVASRFPKTTLQWDSAKLQFDLADANKLVRREYREGWMPKGMGLVS